MTAKAIVAMAGIRRAAKATLMCRFAPLRSKASRACNATAQCMLPLAPIWWGAFTRCHWILVPKKGAGKGAGGKQNGFGQGAVCHATCLCDLGLRGNIPLGETGHGRYPAQVV